jgi:hypothetical protein
VFDRIAESNLRCCCLRELRGEKKRERCNTDENISFTQFSCPVRDYLITQAANNKPYHFIYRAVSAELYVRAPLRLAELTLKDSYICLVAK